MLVFRHQDRLVGKACELHTTLHRRLKQNFLTHSPFRILFLWVQVRLILLRDCWQEYHKFQKSLVHQQALQSANLRPRLNLKRLKFK